MSGEFFIQMVTCKGKLAELPCPPGKQFDTWATLSDMLLTGHELPMRGADEDEHPVKIVLAYEGPETPDGKPTAVASVFLLCPCDIEVIAGARARSELLDVQQNPQQKIQTPNLIVPR